MRRTRTPPLVDRPLGELLDALPAQVLQRAGLGACVGCAMAPHETLGEAVRALNLDLSAVVRQLSRALVKEHD